MNFNQKVEKNLLNYYDKCFKNYGASPQGVGWLNEYNAKIRYNRMLKVVDEIYGLKSTPTILDVGCGYGGLFEYIKNHKVNLQYTGIDANIHMINKAKQSFLDGAFLCEDISEYQPFDKYDYLVCNGILTLKLDATIPEMDIFTKKVIHKMFGICKIGIAFNMYSTYVGWFGDKTYYKNPLEILAYCLSELSHHVKIDHSYRDYEYTIYVYKDNKSLEEEGISYKNA